MLSKKQAEEYDDQTKKNRGYWLLIGAGIFIFLIVARLAMIHVSNRMMQMRQAFTPLFKKGIIILLLGILVLSLLLVIFNYLGKKQERDEHQQ